MEKSLIVFCCLIAALAAEQKISLDDIERDNLHNEKITKLSKSPSASPSSQSPKLLQPSPAQYGFVPLKTAKDYVQQEPTSQYVYNQQFFASRNNKPGVSPQHLQLFQQYQQVLQKQQELKQLQQQQLLRQQQQQLQQLHSQRYVASPQYVVPQVQGQQYVVPQAQGQQYVIPQQYVVQQPQAHQKYLLPAQSAYKQNVQYVTDNHISTQPKQYYSSTAAPQQYVYLQQYTQPSNTIQTVVDPKGGLQYVMYVPAVAPQAYENVVYVDPAQLAGQQTYQQPEYTQQYVQQPQHHQVRPRTRGGPQPKSLLDSYIPSHLQLQYLKQQQQQAQANALRLTLKQSAASAGKGQSAKGAYKDQEEEQGQSGESETALDYDYQLPYYQPGIPRH